MGTGASANLVGKKDEDLDEAVAELGEADRERLLKALSRATPKAAAKPGTEVGSNDVKLIISENDQGFDEAFAKLNEVDKEKITEALSRARDWFFTVDAIVGRSEYKICPGEIVPEGCAAIESWQEGIAAAKKLDFSGDSVAHGAYCANDPNIFRGEHPKGMFKGSNGRFHFNCGDSGCSDGDSILVKKKVELAEGGASKKLAELGFAELVRDASDGSLDDSLKQMEPSIVSGLMDAANRAGIRSLPAAIAEPPTFTAEQKSDMSKKWTEAESLREAIRGGDTVLLKGSWLLRMSKDGEIIQRRQDLPSAGAWEPEDLIGQLAEGDHIQKWEHKVPIVSLSYCWVQPSHPDPHGEQLKSVCKVIDVVLNGFGYGKEEGRKMCNDMAVFWDYGGLYQNNRTDEELESFKRGLKSVNLWYAHKMTTVWMLTKVPNGVRPYDDRGWPNFERELATMTKPFHFALDLGLIHEGYETREYYTLKDHCNSRRSAPMHPSDFRNILPLKAFTNGSDRAFVMNKYNATFEEVMGSAKELIFARLNWGPEEYASVAKCLPYCSNVETLNMNHNLGGNEGMKFIADALPSTRIKNLWFHENRLDANGVDMLVTAAEKMETAQVIQCNFHKLSPEEKQGFEKRWEGRQQGVFG